MQHLVNYLADKAAAMPKPLPAATTIPPGVHAMPPYPEQGGRGYTQVIVINIPFEREFRAANQIIGKGGENMRTVKSETGCKH